MYIKDMDLNEFFWALLPCEYKAVFNHDVAAFGDVIGYMDDIHGEFETVDNDTAYELQLDGYCEHYKIDYMRDIVKVIKYVNVETFEAIAFDDCYNKEALDNITH